MTTAKHLQGSLWQRAMGPLLSLMPRGEKNYLSLDIGSSSVKMLEVRGTGSGMRILNVGIASLPLNAVQGNVIQDVESVTQVIRSLLQQHNIKTTAVITAVPGPAVIIKRATFPAQEPVAL
jgi:type IV pilus assembly protein PilM